jgi:hypothetical protein
MGGSSQKKCFAPVPAFFVCLCSRDTNRDDFSVFELMKPKKRLNWTAHRGDPCIRAPCKRESARLNHRCRKRGLFCGPLLLRVFFVGEDMYPGPKIRERRNLVQGLFNTSHERVLRKVYRYQERWLHFRTRNGEPPFLTRLNTGF